MKTLHTVTQLQTVSTIEAALEQGRKLHDEAVGRAIADFVTSLFSKLAKEDALYGKTLGHAAQ